MTAQPNASRARVLLAEDHAAMAAQLRALLEAAFDVVAVVATGEALERAFESSQPDVVVTDIAMPGAGGLTAVRHIGERHPGTRVVLLATDVSNVVIRWGMTIGIQAFVMKEDAGDELVPAVHAALERRQYLSVHAARGLAEAPR